MKRAFSLGAVVLLSLGACKQPGTPSGGSGADDGGMDAGTGNDGGPWSAPIVVDADPNSGLDLTAVMDPTGHPALAYFTQTATNRFELILAREGATGTWTQEIVPVPSTSSTLPSFPLLTGHYGVGLAFDSTGEPALAFLGGGNADLKTMGDGRWTTFTGTVSEPLPSSAVIVRKTAAGWTNPAMDIADYSNSIVTDGYMIDDEGVVTGLWGALTFDSSGALHAFFRDIHFASAQDDYLNSNLEYLEQDSSGNKLLGELVAGGRVTTPTIQGAGSFLRATIVKGQPGVSYVLSPDDTDSPSQVWFSQRTGPAMWTSTNISTSTGEAGDGPSLTQSAGGQLALAYYRGTDDSTGTNMDYGDLDVATSTDGLTWTNSTLEALGETGHHPAAAFDAENTLGVLYAFCHEPYEPDGMCSPSQELRFRYGANEPEHVDTMVPDATALLVDGSGQFLAFYKVPGGALTMATRSP